MVEVVCCFFISCLEQYRADKPPQNLQRNPQPTNTEWSYLKIPYSITGSLTFLEKKTSQYACPQIPHAQTSPIPHLHRVQMH